MKFNFFVAAVALVLAPSFGSATELPHSDAIHADGLASVQYLNLAEKFIELNGEHSKQWNAACCKTCRKGKACGDSCISRNYTCRKGVGCACDG